MGAQSDLAFEEALGKLRVDANALPWPQRRAVAQSLGDHLNGADPSQAALALVDLLADDLKWEVRREIADQLLLVPEDRFSSLAAKLSGDSNSFVRKAAERALDRRRKGERDVRRRREGIGELAASYATMEKLHGPLAAQTARRLGERFYDLAVGATVHNMRGTLTPLKASILALLRRLSEGDLDQTLSRHLRMIQDSLSMLEQLIDDMRAYAQPVASERRRERLADLIDQARSLVEHNCAEMGNDVSLIELEMLVPQDITLQVSRHQIVTVFTSVLQNAFEAIEPTLACKGSGRIRVSAELTPQEQVRVVIEDSGIGIGADDLKHVREFIPGQTTLKTHGTGFGLPMAKRYIEAHGGSIGIDSREDDGTQVTITLPLEHE